MAGYLYERFVELFNALVAIFRLTPDSCDVAGIIYSPYFVNKSKKPRHKILIY